MQIKVNGKEILLNAHSDTALITSLLENLKIQSGNIAVEKNGVIVERAEYNITEVSEGDVIEIVQFVGGG